MKKLILIISILAVSCGLSAQTIVSGNITGVWNPEGSPYWVNGDINVVDSLIILPGVLVQFEAGGFRIKADQDDKFIAIGTENNPIIFEPKVGTNPGSWWGIELNTSSNNDTLSFCIIRYAQNGVYILNSDSYLLTCEIYGCSENGVYAHQTGSPSLINSSINNNLIGIKIYANNAGPLNPTIYKCQIFDNMGYGIAISNSYHNGDANATIINSTILNNLSSGIRVYQSSSGNADAFISNSIIAYNVQYGISNAGYVGINDVIHNNFWMNGLGDFSGVAGTGFGQNGPYFNYNGDSCDISQNIYYDPLFVDTTNANFNLLENSKCIDAGTNIILGEVVYDPDGTMPDMGANYFDQGGVGYFDNSELISREFEIDVYPNPFSYKATIEFPNPNHSNYTLSVFSINGNKVFELDNIKSDKIEFERGNLPEGVYLIELKGEKVFRGKMVVR